MFDIGWTELLVVAVVAIVVVGPKDLPRMLRSLGQTVGKLKRMANEFQGQFSDVLREAERQADIGDVKKSLDEVKSFDPMADVKNDIEDTTTAINDDLNADKTTSENLDDDDWTEDLKAPDLHEPPQPDLTAGDETAEAPELAEAANEPANAKIADEAKT